RRPWTTISGAWISGASRPSRWLVRRVSGNEGERHGREGFRDAREAKRQFREPDRGLPLPRGRSQEEGLSGEESRNQGDQPGRRQYDRTPEPAGGRRPAAGRAEARRARGLLGYGDEQGMGELRSKIAEKLYRGRIEPHEVFVADGAKCDIGRLQLMFGSGVSIAVQDPAYPVYVDGSVIAGAAGPAAPGGTGYSGIGYLPCIPSNGFFPDLASAPASDILYFCSPNNPTGACATRRQLEELVAFARARGTIIVYDAAYA